MTDQPTLEELTERMKELCELAKHPWPQTNMFNHKFVEMARTYIPLVIEERAELLKDRERLEALIKNSWRTVYLPTHKDGDWHVWGPEGIYGQRFGVGATPREAIDAAIQKGA